MAKKKNNKKIDNTATEAEILIEPAVSAAENASQSYLAAFFQNRINLYIVFGLAITCLVIYGQTFGYPFITLDDANYITDNPFVRNGISFEAVKSAFSTFYFANWHPITTISYQLDVSLFGFEAGNFHLVNVIFHLLNSVLLFVVLKKLTGSTWRSAIVSAIFVVHPTHVESVAWVSQRKDVLSLFFWLWSTYFYIDYARSTEEKRTKLFLFSLLFFVCGFMSKSMVVTLPFTFLLFDYWALERIDNLQIKNIIPLLKEKIPFFILTALFSVITFLAQKSGNAVESLELLPLSTRFYNAFVSFAKYLVMLFYPLNLGVLYPYQKEIPVWQIIASIVLIIAISAYCLWQIKSKKYLFAGWFWFLGTLVPVIGILQVGSQSLADRYTYIPYIGLSLAIVWFLSDLLKNVDYKILFGSTAVILLVFAAFAFRQTSFWQSSETLYIQTLSVTEKNSGIEQNLGVINLMNKKYAESEINFSKALELVPNDFGANSNLTKALIAQGKFDEAAVVTEKIAGFTNMGKVGTEVLLQNYSAIGMGFAQTAEYEKAGVYLKKTLEIDDSKNDIRANLGFILARTGNINDGITNLNEAIRRNPVKPEFYNLLGVVLMADEKIDEAIKQFEKAVQLNPKFKEANDNLLKAKARKK